MKVFIVNASPREDGNSSFIANRLKEKYSEDDLNILNLNSINYKGCQSCYKCRQANSLCEVGDDLSGVFGDLLASDLIILISPNYYGYVTGQMKLFLDRWYCFKDSKRITKFPENTKLFFILTQGAPNRDHGSKVVDWAKKFTESFGIKFYHYIVPGCESESTSIAKLKYDDISMHLNMFV
jgi:multimeric flavodoxin WrbA